MSDKELAEIRQRCEAATPGPWYIDEHLPNVYIRHKGVGWPITSMFHTAGGLWNDDAAFIASARTDMPALLDHIAQLQSSLAEKEAQLARAVEEICIRCESDFFEKESPMLCDQCQWEKYRNADQPEAGKGDH